MPAKNKDLHGNAPDTAPVVLLLIDVINDLEFAGGEDLLRQALPMAERLAVLKRRAARAGVPTVYVTDNFGRWQSDFRKLTAHCLQAQVRGMPVVTLLQPEEEEDYFVLKLSFCKLRGSAPNLRFSGKLKATAPENLLGRSCDARHY
jgi:nicotinamidase-related amidase